MDDKFKDVPVETDTKVLFSRTIELNEISTLYQGWKWDGVIGESLIFVKEDVEKLSDEELITMVKESVVCASNEDVTLSHSKSGYVFVNFNFEV